MVATSSNKEGTIKCALENLRVKCALEDMTIQEFVEKLISERSDFEEAQRKTEQYCEMVAMWKESGGEKGWPAYDGEEVCGE